MTHLYLNGFFLWNQFHAHANEHMHFTEKNLNLNNDYMWCSEVLVLKVTRWEVTYKSTK